MKANLVLRGVEGGIVCEDLFQSSLPQETFDLVFSSGLIEHFDDTRAVVNEHLKAVKPGGRLVVFVPILQGLHGGIIHRLAPSLWSAHRVLGPELLADILKSLGLEQVRSGYAGSFFIRVLRDPEWSVVRRWPGWLQSLVFWSSRIVNGGISLFFAVSPLRPHTRMLSPVCFAAGLKPVR